MIINAIEHNRNQFEVLLNDKDTMHVFNSAYVTYERFDSMTNYAYFSVSQLKKSTIIHKMKSIPFTKNIAVLSNKMVYIGGTQDCKENVFRLLEVVNTNGNAPFPYTFWLNSIKKTINLSYASYVC
ncbi:hypothetical protein COI77_24980 [Bacillus thuringiensis]|nr:hypothetical protein CN351_08015 [Bacillus thuringiensis]PFI32469.1 hypothetical protein COI77_24980 [Bacillus thuringiensis]